MSLEELFHSLPPEQRIFQFGAETDSPLTDAFPRKRVVHAGLHGTVVPPDESQQVWQRIMASAPAKKDIQTAYIHRTAAETASMPMYPAHRDRVFWIRLLSTLYMPPARIRMPAGRM